MGWIPDAVLVVMLLEVALFSVLARESRAAVIGFMAFGLLLALGWVRLGAVDVALTEAAIGALTGVLLLGACTRVAEREEPKPSPVLRLLAAILCTLVAGGLAAIMLDAPDPSPTLAPEAAAHLDALGLGNPVTAVLLAYRALDTLLETVVVVLALIGVWSLAPDEAWRGAPEPLIPAAPNPPLRLLARVLPPIGLVVAVHILWVGADEPGGKFQAATLIAAMWLLVMMAGLAPAPDLGDPRLRLLAVTGPAVFLAVGFFGLLAPGSFLAYPEGWAKPLIVLVEIVLTASIALMLALIVLGPGARKPQR
ncbi:hydrogenase subunit MbhD domain-containing protein [Bosea sp. 117]|uniref:hydrogenase subunit MbhD domain-containing protein n=1 Tax=Bosea sp. 117 TaxID=1125973 RepID=UPI00049441C9|nr:hydrogenase subunit MbhD domain-containing protein [Bosea sp. 117]